MLQQVAKRIAACVRPNDTVARLGGDEFAILRPSCTGGKSLTDELDCLLSSIAEPVEVGGQQVTIGTSIGVACYPEHGDHVEDLLSAADLALYQAKADGRLCYRFFEPKLRDRATQGRMLDGELRRATMRGEFKLFYQPQFTIADERLVGAEALLPVRLRPGADGGYLCPSGSQRLGAALHIQRDQPGFRLRAIISEAMDDREAFALGEADNAGRTSVQPMQQARKWAEALDTIYGGDRQAFIAAIGRSGSVVSRTLALAALPEHILACCSDIDALTPYFAEQLAPRLADPVQESEVRRRAETLAETDKRLPGSKLIRVLLEDAVPVIREPQIVWQSADGVRSVRYRAAGKRGCIELTSPTTMSATERREAVKALDTLLKELGASTSVR